MREIPPLLDSRRPDAESRGWVDALSGAGTRHEEAAAALHAGNLRDARVG